ncbi:MULTISPECIES: DUF2336 domain-containing protein [unclassified Chelatococcus]|uniref:DUF2336 domain-containing protein n=1 Tax=unclassified Chelatococcus TaxID=2638111 RepID=UPI001BD1B1AD|nr:MULTISPECIES: DUF2336 domain-containing protein [unclassified Chelatococcus]MBS7698130.1 DUF2336 domain-containing protein [Chelatococcus sp. YT9]MBX3556552.1 DUF2336 domain-containing protein [Chelatococcus sp.]
MIIRRYLVWATTATASQRAAAADVLVRAYHQSPLTDADRVDIDKALIGLASDESPIVRAALAGAFRTSPAIPTPVLEALLARGDDAAMAILADSPAVSADQLVDCVAIGGAASRRIIAGRKGLPAPVSAAVAEVASLDGLLALLANDTAVISPSAFQRMIDRHGHSTALQSALLGRQDLPPFMRQALMSFLCQRLADYTVDRGWLSPARAGALQVEAGDMATMALVAAATDETLERLVKHLIASGELTVGLLLRSLLCAEPRLLIISLAALTGAARDDIEATLEAQSRAVFDVVYRRAGLNSGLLAAFHAALDALDHLPPEMRRKDGHMSLVMVRRVMLACEDMPSADAGPLLALLERFAEEAQTAERAIDSFPQACPTPVAAPLTPGFQPQALAA